MMNEMRNAMTRRALLRGAGSGLGAIAMSAMLAESGFAGVVHDPTIAKKPHHEPKAKRVIFLFMEGAPSHIDLFDPKPKLNEMAGQPMPASFGRPITAMGTANNTLMGSPRQWKQHGKSGIWVSELYPHIAKHVDKLAVLRSCQSDGLNHAGGVSQMNTGDILSGRPSLGAWVTYGLGTANKDLPTFVSMIDEREPFGNAKNWGSGFLPAVYQGTLFRQGPNPILNTKLREGMTDERQRAQMQLLEAQNREYALRHEDDSTLQARIRSFELAYALQKSGPEAVDLSKETEETKELYGLNDPATAVYGRNCLLGRRLLERGVRFVELYCGSGSGWDAHSNLEGNHKKWCKASDKPVAALLEDLERRGMLEDTLVIWGGEFGRTPFNEKGDGRDHNPWGFTMWFAGGGVKGGQTIGATDDIGLRAIERHAHVTDIHASILWLLGLDHLRLTYMHNGRAERPTGVKGEHMVKELWQG
ncbi:MAG: DUF1501 domain-containing protein [Bryobacterales bacterium]|nr:DUF1501 domain-containing protein [Bryobacterales bacterium]